MGLKVYTPTPDGFERFLREAIGLPTVMLGDDYCGQVNIAWGVPKR
jgi:hypothetical protein